MSITEQFAMLAVRETTKNYLIDNCVKEYLRCHPEMKRIKITSDKILYEVVKYYLKDNDELSITDD